jgi:predicted 2-oxoglutarate/Fe(II)-dependent dioxygenase YbiX
MDWIWNLGIQLNTNYVGGDYICYNINNEVVNISKEIGNVVAYQSDVLHEIKEIASGVRYSMVIKIHSWELIHKNEKSLF